MRPLAFEHRNGESRNVAESLWPSNSATHRTLFAAWSASVARREGFEPPTLRFEA